ncbi:porin family protein [Polluticaenibacter yanchengensis]|uniref:Porin family protein n=1 Tax=Polluticaenibacter yanchengensis TaxID=3014562 RepID=A0ABT4UIU9_9BACT|nr:porin family protein [Chitinophagaceae bacterium LY-5]
MKKYHFLKTLLFAGIALLINESASAQTDPVSFGIKAGYNLSGASVNDATGTNSKSGYHIGGTVEYSLSKKILIQSGLIFSTKGSKIHQLNASGYIPQPPDDTHTFNQSYLILPVYGAYKLNIKKDVNIVFAAGPYLGYGIGGKTTQKLNKGAWSEGVTEISWNTFGDGIYDTTRDWLRGTTLKRLDVGVGANINVEYRQFILGIGYEQGLRNIAEQAYHKNLKYKNNNLQFSLAYKLR